MRPAANAITTQEHIRSQSGKKLEKKRGKKNEVVKKLKSRLRLWCMHHKRRTSDKQ